VRVLIVYLLLTIYSFAAEVTAVHQSRVLAFEARDQHYVSHGPGYSLSVSSGAAELNLRGHSLRLTVVGGNRDSRLEAFDKMPGKANYLLGRDVRASYELFGKVRSRAVYPGIDLVFRGNQEHLEYDFEVSAGRDPRQIGVTFGGADQLRIDTNGALVLRTGNFEVTQPAPYAYQLIGGHDVVVSVAYQMGAGNQVHFQLGKYDRSQTLVIDPQLIFENSFGGGGITSASGIALDAKGNIYVAGQTNSADFPQQGGAQNHPGAASLIASLDNGQSWSSVPLSATSSVTSIVSAPTQPVTVYAATVNGTIRSADGGTTWTTPANTGLIAPSVSLAADAGAPSTVYAASFAQGVFTSTDGGGSWTLSNNGLRLDNSSATSPVALLSSLVASPKQAGTVFAIADSPGYVYRSTDAGQTWVRVLLATDGGSPRAMAFSPTDANTAYLGQLTGPFLKSTDGGATWQNVSSQTVSSSHGLVVLAGNPSAILAAGDQSLVRSTDGGVTWNNVLALQAGTIAADPRNSNVAYAMDSTGLYRSSDAGQTWSKTSIPYQNAPFALFVSAADSRILVGEAVQSDAFVTKWSPDGTKILYSTFLGGSASDAATGLAVDSVGSVYVTGMTASKDFPVTKGAFQTTLATGRFGNGRNAFVAKLTADGSQLAYATLLGGGAEASSRIAVNAAGEALICGRHEQCDFSDHPRCFPNGSRDTVRYPIAVHSDLGDGICYQACRRWEIADLLHLVGWPLRHDSPNGGV